MKLSRVQQLLIHFAKVTLVGISLLATDLQAQYKTAIWIASAVAGAILIFYSSNHNPDGSKAALPYRPRTIHKVKDDV